MAYAQGDVILDDHYNEFATGDAAGTANHSVRNINSIWGVGNGDKGYGQSTVLTAVSAGTTVSATQWSTMIARLNSILTHVRGTGSGLTSPTVGDTVTYLANLNGNITTAYNDRLSFNSIRGTAATVNHDGTWNVSPNPTTFTQVRTVTFASGDAARYFFNAGGRIGISVSIPAGGTDTSKETAWTSLLGGVSTLNFDALTSARTGSGQTLSVDGSSIGYHDLTSSDQVLIRLTATTAPYTANYFEILGRSNGVQGANADKGSLLTFTINYYDNEGDSFNDAINMTMRAAVTITPPESTNISSTWGTPTSAATTN